MERAQALMEVLDEIREALRKPKSTPAGQVIQVDERLGEERNLPGVPEVEGIKHTAIARRMLLKGVRADEPDEFRINSHRVFTIFTPKEKALFGKLTLATFRSIAKSCPPKLGKFEEETDDFVYTIPVAEGDGLSMALRTFANAPHGLIRSALCPPESKKRKGGNLRASQ